MSLKKQTISGVKWTTIATIILALSGLLKLSVLARVLDKADFGLMAIITFILGFMTIFMDMGLTTAILHKQEISKKEYASLYWLNLVFSLVLALLISLLAPYIASFYNEPELIKLIPLASTTILLSGIGRQFKTIFQKNFHFKLMAIVDSVSAISSLGVAITLALKGFGVYTLVYAAILQFIVNNGLYFILGIKEYGFKFWFRMKDTKPFLNIGVYQVGGQVINYFNRDLEILIIGKYFGAEILGGYSLAKQLVLRPSQVINPVLTKVAAPVLAKFQSNKLDLKNNYLKLVNIISTINLPIYIALALFAPFIITLFYGEGYEQIIILVRILSIYMFIRSISNPIGSLITATGKTKIEFTWNLIITLFYPIAIWIGTQYSIEGVAISMVLIILVLFIPSWWFLVKKLTGATLKEYVSAIIPTFHLTKL